MQFKLPAVICYFNNCLRIGKLSLLRISFHFSIAQSMVQILSRRLLILPAVMHVTIFLLCLLAIDRYISIVWNGFGQNNSRKGIYWTIYRN